MNTQTKLSISDAAALYKKSRATIYKDIKNGNLSRDTDGNIDLDEGPIIEQEVQRVDHAYLPDDLVSVGRDTETVALSKAVKYFVEHRVFLNDDRTVVFK